MLRLPRGTLLLSTLLGARSALGADIQAGPGDYRDKVDQLAPGDTLHLAAGTYTELLSISGLNGSEAQPITITGPDQGTATFEADPGPCCNTIEISNSSYVVIKKLVVDGKKVDGAFGVNASGGSVHHITLDGLGFVNHDASQQTVAISTKVTTWGWVIRNNRIVGAGTGLYLGNSDGTQPFIGGLIENNLVEDPIGYCMEIKWQKPRTGAGIPQTPTSTVIRNNVFIKSDRPSEDGDRPNVLVGGFPDTGPGAQDLYEIYGNFFFHNPRESLFQGSGRVSIHDNIFVDASSAAIRLQNHDLPLKLARVYNNTIYAAATGIGFSSAAPEGDLVTGNLVFADTPISGSIQNQRENIVDATANAASFVASPTLTLGSMDFYPLPGKCTGSALDLTSAATDVDYAKDFNGTNKGGFTYRGAYAGEGANPGWKLTDDLKRGGGAGGSSGSAGTGGNAGTAGAAAAGTAGGGASGGAAGSGGSSAGNAGTGSIAGGSAGQPAAGGAAADDGGCGCRTPRGTRVEYGALIAILAAAIGVRRNKRRSQR